MTFVDGPEREALLNTRKAIEQDLAKAESKSDAMNMKLALRLVDDILGIKKRTPMTPEQEEKMHIPVRVILGVSDEDMDYILDNVERWVFELPILTDVQLELIEKFAGNPKTLVFAATLIYRTKMNLDQTMRRMLREISDSMKMRAQFLEELAGTGPSGSEPPEKITLGGDTLRTKIDEMFQ